MDSRDMDKGKVLEVDIERYRRYGRDAVAVAVMMMFFALIWSPLMAVQAATPDHSASDVKVENARTEFSVVIVLQAKDNGTYHVEISDIDKVTDRFELLDNGTSEKKDLAAGTTSYFNIKMITKPQSVAETNAVPYEVYQNDVLVSNGIVNITVKETNVPPENPFSCSSCSFFIPLSIVGGLFLVQKRKARR